MRILAIDDEPTALRILTRSIKEVNANAELHTFDSASSAIKDVQSGFLPDVAFLDIELPETNGVELAKRLKDIHKNVNIVFVTGYSEYAMSAIDLRASGYLLKPVTAEQIKTELENLRNPIKTDVSKKLVVRTFENFEVFAGDKCVDFSRSKAKEIFAYLIDRNGTSASYAEIAAVLWEDEVYNRARQKQLYNCIDSMIKSLKEVNAEDVVVKNRLGIMVDKSKIDCDAYRFFDGDTTAINAYHGEYMSAYSWAEFTNGKFCLAL